MITTKDIKWGSYDKYEGPVYHGKLGVSINNTSTFLEKCLYIISKTEGKIESVNMYDAGIVSVGIMQYIERTNFGFSDLLGMIAERCGISYVNKHLGEALKLSNATFRQTEDGKRWRFYQIKNNDEIKVNNAALQREIFLSCTGERGKWTEANKVHAKTWCAAIVNVLSCDDLAVEAQIDFCSERLFKYVFNNGKKYLYSLPDETGIKGALKAIYVSYSINLPKYAEEKLYLSFQHHTKPWSNEWVANFLKKFSTESGIKHWPNRYDNIVQAVNECFNVKFPTSSFLLGKTTAVKSSSFITTHPYYEKYIFLFFK